MRPPGMGHLEDPTLTADLTVARDFDLGHDRAAAVTSRWTSSPRRPGRHRSPALRLRRGAVRATRGGRRSLLAAAWLSTHWLLRESAVWRDRNTDEVREAQRHADYAYRLAVDPPAAKELRLFGLSDWTIERFVARRTQLHELQYQATRLRERPVVWSLLIVLAANVLVFWALAADAAAGAARPRRRSWSFAQVAVGRRA